MNAILVLILFLLFIIIVLNLAIIGILIYNRIIVFRKTKQDSQLVHEIKHYFETQNIRKVGF